MKKKDLNNLKDFDKWLDKTFAFVDFQVKKYMHRAWCARGKYDRLKNKKVAENK